MNSQHANRLYDLLPAVYRERDASEGYPLQALLGLVQEQSDIVGMDIERLWNNFFIETCDHWVIPYIGDLVSNNLLHADSGMQGPDTAGNLFVDLEGRNLRPDSAVRSRADVAKTIYYRRRKGTLPMLEELARDVTGWPVHAVEFFQRLGWTQNLNHLRLANLDCPDLRKIEPLDRLNGPFDTISHTLDVRRPRQREGWYNIPNIGFFLWRLRSYRLSNVLARQPGKERWRYHFSPLGNPVHLFGSWRREGDEAGLATELHVPAPIRPAALHEDLERCRRSIVDGVNSKEVISNYYGEDKFFSIHKDGKLLPTESILCKDLRNWDRPPDRLLYRDTAGNDVKIVIEAAVDVRLGRITFPKKKIPRKNVKVMFHYGFSADLGGGPYTREKWRVRSELAQQHYRVLQEGTAPPGAPSPTHSSLIDALTDVQNDDSHANTIITILDSRTYALPDVITLDGEQWLVIEAANQQRPLLQSADDGLEIKVAGGSSGGINTRAEFTLSGVVVEGHVHVTGDLERFRLLHTTLIPGRRLRPDGKPVGAQPSLIVEGGTTDAVVNTRLRLEIAYSITGPLRVPEHATGLWILDAIVDGVGAMAIAAKDMIVEPIVPWKGRQPAPPTTLERVTIFGRSLFKRLDLATEVIFTEAPVVSYQQAGCVRFSYIPSGSKTPRRYRCQPDHEIAKQIDMLQAKTRMEGVVLSGPKWDQISNGLRVEIQNWLVPSFTAVEYGLPGYAQLRLSAPLQIRTGAEDGSEMGAFSHLKQPQRETNLRFRLEEYLPFGLESGFIYIT